MSHNLELWQKVYPKLGGIVVRNVVLEITALGQYLSRAVYSVKVIKNDSTFKQFEVGRIFDYVEEQYLSPTEGVRKVHRLTNIFK